MSWSFGNLFGSRNQHITENIASSKQDTSIRIELTEELEPNIERIARHIIRRIHCKNLEGLKCVIESNEPNNIDDIFNYVIENVNIGRKGESDEKIYVGETVINYAMGHAKYDICKYLVKVIKNPKIFTDIESDTYSAFHCAAINKDPEVLQLLLDAKINGENIIKDVNMRSKKGNTPLHFACRYGNPDNVDKLLAIDKVNYDIANIIGAYPIHWAAYGGHLESLKKIFKKYEEEDIAKYKELIQNERINLNKEWLDIKGEDTSGKTETEEEVHKRVELILNKKFGEYCLKLEGKRCGVPLLCAALNVQSESLEDPHFKCVSWILDQQMEADATCRDDDCDTVLHFISRKASPEQLAKILKANALLGVKNEVGNIPLDWITAETMRNVLDNHLQKIEFGKKKGDFNTKDRYHILFTNFFGHHASGSDIKNILALAQSSEHQELALHPICQSILSVKWQKMWKYYVLKLLFFIPFVILLSVYPTLKADLNNTNDTQTKYDIEKNLAVIWYSLYSLLFIQVVFGTLSVLVLVGPFWKETKVYLSHINPKRVLRILEFYWNEFLWSDWYEYILWILAFLLLHDKISPLPVVIASWFSLFFVCSNHPSILPFRYILTKILFNYLKFLIFASGLISGFAMGFYMLLKECKINDEPCVNGAFTSISTTALKIPSMMLGDIDFHAFSLDLNDFYLYLLFGSFIFLVTMCLFNMMNALAINITDEMMKKAHVFKTIAECDMTYEFEILLKEISGWLKWFGFRKITFLSPVWIERLRASPNSGKCQNLDQISLTMDRSKLNKNDLWDSDNKNKALWYWHDRGYELDRKIIYKANSIFASELEKHESEQRKNIIYKNPYSHHNSDEEDDNNVNYTENENNANNTKNLLQVPNQGYDCASEDECDVSQEVEPFIKPFSSL